MTALPRTILDDQAAIAARVARNVVYCTRCKFQQAVDGAQCLATGWPSHCLATMSIDSPEERSARNALPQDKRGNEK